MADDGDQSAFDRLQGEAAQVRDNLKNPFQDQRQKLGDWWNNRMNDFHGLVNKYGGSPDVKAASDPDPTAAQPKTVSAKTTTPSIKRSAAKRKSAGAQKTFGTGK